MLIYDLRTTIYNFICLICCMKKILLAICYLLITTCLQAQLNTPKNTFTKADTLRGSNNENRSWWDVLRYDITVKPDFEKKEIEGVCKITFKLRRVSELKYDATNLIKLPSEHIPRKKKDCYMQIDLQYPMQIDSFLFQNQLLEDDNPYLYQFDLEDTIEKNYEYADLSKYDLFYDTTYELKIYYHGKPQEAKKAPWDGGWVWGKDKLGRPFVSVACQGLGASCWFPCKDYQGDEPDNGASLTIIRDYYKYPKLIGVSNGRNPILQPLDSGDREIIFPNHHGYNVSYKWDVKNPINTYCIVPYIGAYDYIIDTFKGEKGILNLSYYFLDYNKEKAQEQFKQVKPMLRAFEYWFGAYPFYEDGYKLVEAPYLGMEHQSAIAYGNGYQNGYKGRDLSGSDSGWGLKWDFIIVHESGHEWFANSITTNDIADMWVHEGFTNYSEVLFTEYYYGKEAGNDYCYGLRKSISNDEPIIGPYGVNKEGSSDMYYKASNMIHSIRNALNDDEKFRKILRGMNERFYHKTVDGSEIEQYLINETGLDLQKTFDQYLTTTQIPTLEYYFKGKKLFYRYTNCIDGFNMPVTIPSTNKKIIPTTEWQHKRLRMKNEEWFNSKNVERLYLLKVKNTVNEIK